MIIQQFQQTGEPVLKAIDALPIFSAEDIRGVAQAMPARGDVTLTKEQAYALFLIVDTTARIERGAYPTTNYLRELLLPTYRAWHDANPGTAHPALVVPSTEGK